MRTTTARLPGGVGAGVGFRFRRGCDREARKLRKSPNQTHEQSQVLTPFGHRSRAASGLRAGPGAQLGRICSRAQGNDLYDCIPCRRKEPEPGDLVPSHGGLLLRVGLNPPLSCLPSPRPVPESGLAEGRPQHVWHACL